MNIIFCRVNWNLLDNSIAYYFLSSTKLGAFNLSNTKWASLRVMLTLQSWDSRKVEGTHSRSNWTFSRRRRPRSVDNVVRSGVPYAWNSFVVRFHPTFHREKDVIDAVHRFIAEYTVRLTDFVQAGPKTSVPTVELAKNIINQSVSGGQRVG